MPENGGEVPGSNPGDKRGGDRRGTDRRRTDRRAPLPPWRRPWAFAAYGAAVVLVFFTVRSCASGDDTGRVAGPTAPVSPAAAPLDTAHTPRPTGQVEDATATGDFERLTLQGEAAKGRMVKAQLYCDAPIPVALETTTDTVEAPIAAVADTMTHRVPAADCKWGAQDDPRREDFLLVVPPERAAEFAAQPVMLDGFVRRRRLIANVEWIGKSRALALSTVGVFRGLSR
jgi:hypothetical protein